MAETKSQKKLMSGSNPFLRNKDLGPQSLLRAFFCVLGCVVRMGEEVGGSNKIKRGIERLVRGRWMVVYGAVLVVSKIVSKSVIQ